MDMFSVMAPTGQTAAHWPHCTQMTSLRSVAKAGPMTVVKPRFCGKRAPTPWISLHTVTQRRHETHLPESRTRAGGGVVDVLRGLLALVGDAVHAEGVGEARAARSRRCARRPGSRRRARRGAVRARCGGRGARAACWSTPPCRRWPAGCTTRPACARPRSRPGRGGRRRWPARSPGSTGWEYWRPPCGRPPRHGSAFGHLDLGVVNSKRRHYFILLGRQRL